MSRDVPILDLDVPLVEQLRGEGELLARGAFGLDEERAREKLQSFQLVSPHHYVLELLGCATLLGARHISYEVRARRMRVHFDGEPLTREELDGLYSSAFDRSLEPRRRALRHLAVALSALEGLALSSIVIEAGYEEFARLTVRPGEPDELDEPGQLDEPGMSVAVRERLRLGNIFPPATSPEEQVLRAHARFARSRVLVNGEVVSLGMKMPERRYDMLTFVRTAAEYGKIGLIYSESDRQHEQAVTTAWLVQNGVFVSRHTLSWPYGHVDMIIDSRRLTKNLSQSAFVEDEAWHKLHDDVLEEALCWLMLNRVEMAYGDPGGPPSPATPTHVRGWMDRALRGVIERAAQRRRDGKPLGEHMRALARFAEHRPLIAAGAVTTDERYTSDTRVVSLASLEVGLDVARAPRFVDAGKLRRHHDALAADSPDLALVEDYLGRDAVHLKTGEARARPLPWGRTDERDPEAEAPAPEEPVEIGLVPGGDAAAEDASSVAFPELQLGAFYLGEREGEEAAALEDAPAQVEVGREADEVALELGEAEPPVDMEGWVLALLEPATRAAKAWSQPAGVRLERNNLDARIRFGQLVFDPRVPEVWPVVGEGVREEGAELEGLERAGCDLARAVPLARRALGALMTETRLGRQRRLDTQRALLESILVWSRRAREVELARAQEDALWSVRLADEEVGQ